MRPAQRVGNLGFQPDGTSSVDGGERVPTFMQNWVKRPSFSAYDIYGWGKKMIYFSPFVSRRINTETSCQMRNNLIFVNHCMKRRWQCHRGRARLNCVVSSFVLLLPLPLVSSAIPANLMVLINLGS